jgi:hypothetical protein
VKREKQANQGTTLSRACKQHKKKSLSHLPSQTISNHGIFAVQPQILPGGQLFLTPMPTRHLYEPIQHHRHKKRKESLEWQLNYLISLPTRLFHRHSHRMCSQPCHWAPYASVNGGRPYNLKTNWNEKNGKNPPIGCIVCCLCSQKFVALLQPLPSSHHSRWSSPGDLTSGNCPSTPFNTEIIKNRQIATTRHIIGAYVYDVSRCYFTE